MEISRVIDLARPAGSGAPTTLIGPRAIESSTLPMSEIPVSRLTGRALVFDLSAFEIGHRVRFVDVATTCDYTRTGDIALFRTARDGTARAVTIDPEVVAALIVRGVLAFGTDLETLDSDAYRPIDQMIAAASGVLCVNLHNLDELSSATTIVEFIPDSTATDSGSTRAMAFELA
jgi:kynurenine formamidase